jgi:hypothetical protein
MEGYGSKSGSVQIITDPDGPKTAFNNKNLGIFLLIISLRCSCNVKDLLGLAASQLHTIFSILNFLNFLFCLFFRFGIKDSSRIENKSS